MKNMLTGYISKDGETLTLEIIYSNSEMHSGVMGLFYILVAEQLPHQHHL